LIHSLLGSSLQYWGIIIHSAARPSCTAVWPPKDTARHENALLPVAYSIRGSKGAGRAQTREDIHLGRPLEEPLDAPGHRCLLQLGPGQDGARLPEANVVPAHAMFGVPPAPASEQANVKLRTCLSPPTPSLACHLPPHQNRQLPNKAPCKGIAKG
jgi:hypothetical protein